MAHPEGAFGRHHEDGHRSTQAYTNSVTLADINVNRRLDSLSGSGGNDEAPGEAEFSRVFLNQGFGKMFEEVAQNVLGAEPMFAVRIIRVVDVNSDSKPDMVMNATFKAKPLCLRQRRGVFRNVTTTYLPQIDAGVEDVRCGEGDGDRGGPAPALCRTAEGFARGARAGVEKGEAQGRSDARSDAAA